MLPACVPSVGLIEDQLRRRCRIVAIDTLPGIESVFADRRCPATIVRPPSKLFAPVSVSVPAPVFSTRPLPLMSSAKVPSAACSKTSSRVVRDVALQAAAVRRRRSPISVPARDRGAARVAVRRAQEERAVADLLEAARAADLAEEVRAGSSVGVLVEDELPVVRRRRRGRPRCRRGCSGCRPGASPAPIVMPPVKSFVPVRISAPAPSFSSEPVAADRPPRRWRSRWSARR